jgi:hypothetical protein
VGETVQFKVTATGTSPFGYQWSFNGSPVSGATKSSLFISSIETNDAGSYFVVITNPAGAITSSVAMLTAIVPPAIASPPQSQTVLAGKNAAFSVSATGTETLYYQWALNGAPLPGATNSNLLLTNIQLSDAGTYSVLVANAADSTASSTASLIVTPPATSADIALAVDPNVPMIAGGFTLNLSVPANSTYTIEASTDLQTWTSLTTNVTVSGIVVFTDTAAANYPSRFYRAAVLQ